jgi:hypothetical protein
MHIPTGIDDPNLVIALPISPKKAFMATQSDHVATILRRQRPKELAARLNESSLHQVRARVYAADAKIESFIRNRMRNLSKVGQLHEPTTGMSCADDAKRELSPKGPAR